MKRLVFAVMIGAMPSLLGAQGDPVADLMYPQAQRVRVTAPSLSRRPMVGRVAGLDSQAVSLTVTPRGTVVSYPFGDITALHASAGIDRRTGVHRGALIGLAAGAVFFGTTYPEIRESDYWGIAGLALGLVAFGITPGIGALAGYALAPEAWEPRRVPDVRATTPGRVRISFSPEENVRLKSTRGSFSGRVASQTTDLVTIVTKNETVPLRWSEVTRVSVRGEKSRQRGAVRGAIIITAITAIGVATDPLPTFVENLGVVAGNALFGAAIGMFVPMRSWTHLPIPRGAGQ